MGGGSSYQKNEVAVSEPQRSLTEASLLEDKSMLARHMTERPNPTFQNMSEADINKMLEAYTDVTLELSLAREADFVGFLAEHKLPPFESIPSQVYQLHQLIELNFSHNQLIVVDNSIGELKLLKKLDLGNNRLRELPDTLCNLTCLNTLIISENQLTNLPSELGNCTQLEKLIGFKNQLSTLPDSIARCRELKEINLFNNKLSNLGTGFYDLENLVEVNIAGNAVTQLESFSKLVNLKRIAAYQNKIKVFPSLISCTQLLQLQIYRNVLKELPDLTNLSSLTELDANSNQIRAIPEVICTPQSNLKNINLRKNRLLTIPPYIGNLKKLEILNLGGNPISSPLPSELASLTCLVSLLLDDTNLTVLPSNLTTMTNLVRVDVGSRIDHLDSSTDNVMNQLEIICKNNKGWLKQS